MGTVINVVLFVILTAYSIGEAKMPDEYQADWVGDFPFGGNVHDIFYVSGKNTRRQNAAGIRCAPLIGVSTIGHVKRKVAHTIVFSARLDAVMMNSVHPHIAYGKAGMHNLSFFDADRRRGK